MEQWTKAAITLFDEHNDNFQRYSTVEFQYKSELISFDV